MCLYVPVIPARRDRSGVKLKIQQFNEESVYFLGRACVCRKLTFGGQPGASAGHLPGLDLPLRHRKLRLGRMRELIFEVTQEADGGYSAECLTETIVTEGDTWEELRQNVREVVKAFYFDQPDRLPTTLRLHLVRDEVLAYA